MQRYSKLTSLLIGLILSGCSHDLGMMRLEERLTSYGEAVRWGLMERAADFQTEKARQVSISGISPDIHISGYDPVYRHKSDDGKTVDQAVELSYFQEQTGVVKKFKDRQTWKFDDKKNQWFLDSPLPAFPK